MFKGVYTAIVTPFKNGKLDERAFRDLIEWQIQEGIHGIVASGSTGEGMTLSEDEWEKLIQISVEQAANRVPVIAGAGSNCTEVAVQKTKKAYKLGATAVLQVTPYYNKPTQEGLYQHFKAIAEAEHNMPVILYNVPGRTAVNMLPETVARLSKIKNIVALKEACGDLTQVRKLKKLLDDKFAILCGEDAQNLSVYELGGVGTISVASNLMPAKVAEVYEKFVSGDLSGAKLVQEELQPLNKAIFIETNPIPAKTALFMMGRIKEEFRLPLTQMEKGNKEKLKDVLQDYGLIS